MLLRVGKFALIVTISGVLAAGLTGCSGDDDTDTTEVPVLEADQSLIGACLAFDADTGAEITAFPRVDCAEPHSHEVFAVLDSKERTYPGFEALEAEAQVACMAEFEPYVGIDAFDSELFYEWIVPTLDSWDRADDRQIVCVAGNLNGAPLQASVRDSKR